MQVADQESSRRQTDHAVRLTQCASATNRFHKDFTENQFGHVCSVCVCDLLWCLRDLNNGNEQVTSASDALEVEDPHREETRPETALASPKSGEPKTPKQKSSSKVKRVPNFARLHATEFNKMKSVADCVARRNILGNVDGASGADSGDSAFADEDEYRA
ncbi:hypothetical protein V5799_020517 [Amblyomma americanum]|uniref:Uncharacterized protein n=1 Tax=Amblyomma americanum TaxID=6943 RepID=A0AAQ4ETL5_AMBAM